MADFKSMAAQLRKPHGEEGREVALQMNQSNDVLTLLTISGLALTPADNVLEVGMGNGLFCKDVLAVENTRYTGCDFSELMIAEASTLNRAYVKAGKAKFVLADVVQMPFPDHTFDKIFTVNTIYFWDTPVNVLSEIRRVLKPGGLLAIGLRTEESMRVLPFVQYGFTGYNETTLRELLHENSFRVMDLAVTPDKKIQRQDDSVQMENMVAVCTPVDSHQS